MKDASIIKQYKYNELNEEKLRNLFIQQKMFIREIAKEYECSEDLISKKLKKYNIRSSERDNSNKKNHQDYIFFQTKSLPAIYEYTKMSVKDCLKELDAESFIVWLMDDGTVEGRYNNAYSIGCSRFTPDEINYAIQVIHEKFNINGSIHKNKSCKYGHVGIRFSVNESKKITDLINCSNLKNMVYETMSYKIIDR